MSQNRKLQTEIDRVYKKIAEGVENFEDIWNKLYSTDNLNQKEKFEADLKKEIKKLQRHRDQIKTWVSSGEVKDKKPLLEQRKLIETQMERFKACEKEMKTKAYSKEGLASNKMDPREKAKMETRKWIAELLDVLGTQIDSYEAELESLQAKKKATATTERIEKIEKILERHKFHQSRLELILRLVENDSLEIERINPLKDDITYYTESHEDPDFIADEGLYDELELQDDMFDDEDSDMSDIDSDGESVPKPKKEREKPVVEATTAPAAPTSQPVVIVPSVAVLPSPVVTPGSVPTAPAAAAAAPPKQAATQPPAASTALPSVSSTPSQIPVQPAAQPVSAVPAVAKQVPTPSAPATAPASTFQAPVPSSSTTAAAAAASAVPKKASKTDTKPQVLPPVQLPVPTPTQQQQQPKQVLPLPQKQTAATVVGSTPIAPATSSAPALATPATLASAASVVKPSTTIASLQQQPSAALPPTSTPLAPATAPPVPTVAPAAVAQPAPALSLASSAPTIASAPQPVSAPVPAVASLPSVPSAPATTVETSAPAPFQSQPHQTSPSLSDYGSLNAADPVSNSLLSLLAGKDIATALSANPLKLENTNLSASTSSVLPGLTTMLVGSGPSAVQQQQQAAAAAAVAGAMLADASLREEDRDFVMDAFASSGKLPSALADLLPGYEAFKAKGVAEGSHQQVVLLESSFQNLPDAADAERPRHYVPRNPQAAPTYYPQAPASVLEYPSVFEKFDTDTLFFVFYFQQGTYQQYLAARELKKQSWRFHKKYLTWFQRHEEPKAITEEYEQGTYVYFDYETSWCQRKKSEFSFEYRWLEDESFV